MANRYYVRNGRIINYLEDTEELKLWYCEGIRQNLLDISFNIALPDIIEKEIELSEQGHKIEFTV